MAAGAPRHRAPKKAWGSTGNVLQAFGVAAGGLLAVTVMTVLAGGPASPDTVVAFSPTASSKEASTSETAAGRGTQVVNRPVAKAEAEHALIWSVGGGTVLRPIGPTIPAPPSAEVPPRIISTLAPAATPSPTPTPTPSPTPTPTPSSGPPRVQPPPVVHAPKPSPTPTPAPTPPPPSPTPEPTPTDPPSAPLPSSVVPGPLDLPPQVPPDLPVG